MSYKEAMTLLKSLSVPDVNEEYNSRVPAMIRDLNRLGYKVSDLDKLNILHVTGTKGKGSTVTFCESILRHQGIKTGAYISPHIVTVRERFLIDGEPVSEEIFAEHILDLFEKLQKTKESETDMPHRFAFMTLLAFDIFLRNGVEALVLEVGIGGEFDCTNVISAPVVCGVSSIHLDHVEKLGKTVESIAWHKSGIFKPGAPAVTVSQLEGVMSVLQSRATERQTILILAPSLDDYETDRPIKLGLAGDVQKMNASLALQMCKIWKKTVKPGFLSKILDCESQAMNGGIEESCKAELSKIRPNVKLTTNELKAASNRGRTHTIRHADVTYFFDTSHTDISIKAYADWFLTRTNEEQKNIRGRAVKVMIFYFARERDLMKPLTIMAKIPFDVALFCPLAADEASRVETLYEEAPLEEQMSRTIEGFEIWNKLNSNNPQHDGQGHNQDCKGDHYHMQAISSVVPSLKQALALATCGKDGGVLNGEAPETICKEFPNVSGTIQSADQVQVMIVGGHKVVGHSLSFLEN